MSSSCARVELWPEKTGDVVEESVSETSGRDMELRFQEFFAACLAEFFLHGVLGFEESVRIEQTAISGANADFHGRIGCFGKHAQHRPFSSISLTLPAAREASMSGGWPAAE